MGEIKIIKNKYYKPTISEWGDFSLGTFAKPLREIIDTILDIALNSDKNDVDFPIIWSRKDGKGSDGIKKKEITDPLIIYLVLEEIGGQKGTPVYEINLRDALANDIEECATDGSFSYGLGRLSTALRKLADEIDEAREKSKNKISPWE